MFTSRSLARTLFSLAVATAITLGLTVPVGADPAIPPNIPSLSTAESELATLAVAPDGSMSGYSRSKFPHWITEPDGCTAREEVLERDGSNVQVDADCYPVSGTWTGPYDGKTIAEPSRVQIDHLVPLADAWRTGAAGWTTAERQDFANDLVDPQLVAVSASSNEAKGDQPPDRWKPPLHSYWCTYAEMWIGVKTRWSLTVNPSEKSALSSMLSTC